MSSEARRNSTYFCGTSSRLPPTRLGRSSAARLRAAAALTELGAHPRSPTAHRAPASHRCGYAPGCPSAHFTEIINDLADHAQVILYSQFWQVNAGRTYSVSGPGLDWELHWTAPWEHLVEESRTCYLLEASEAPAGDNIFVAPTWIDRTDLHPEK
ncbi:hypothetical protein [Streptomyces sp. NPDC088746]|uniref:hypothetical protein n=1 Tax=Streptomyces sp. NPDC088746 TaxID=3365885 RepID=UPI0037F50BCD